MALSGADHGRRYGGAEFALFHQIWRVGSSNNGSHGRAPSVFPDITTCTEVRGRYARVSRESSAYFQLPLSDLVARARRRSVRASGGSLFSSGNGLKGNQGLSARTRCLHLHRPAALRALYVDAAHRRTGPSVRKLRGKGSAG